MQALDPNAGRHAACHIHTVLRGHSSEICLVASMLVMISSKSARSARMDTLERGLKSSRRP